MTEKVAILITVCGRNLTCTTLGETPFYKIFLPFFEKSKENDYHYKFFIGIDDNDYFFLNYLNEMKQNPLFEIILLQNCNHKPAKAWNILFEAAYKNGYDYFFQVGDDVAMTSVNWTSRFINTLKQNGNFGVTGPNDDIIFQWRKELNLHQVIENAFVHKTHYEIFQTFFHPEIENQFCDDWITLVYDKFALLNINIKCENTVRNARYNAKKVTNIRQYVDDGKESLKKFREKLKIVDAFIFHNEYDLLHLRLEELYNIVDHFVLVEANVTHSGAKKDWNFEKNKQRYSKYANKIIYIQCDDLSGKNSWEIENAHRNAIARCFHLFSDSDIILMSDVDEIPKKEIIEQIRFVRLPIRFHMDFYNYNFNCRVIPDWKTGTVAFFKTILENHPPQCLRLISNLPYIENAGWHFSWFGDEEYCKEKIRSFAHQELNNEVTLKNFKERMKKYEDYCPESGRNWKFHHVYLHSSLPISVTKLSFLNKFVDNPKHNLYFATYGDSNFLKSRERIIKEANAVDIFKDCYLYTEDNLSDDFKEKFSHLLSQKRGGGYWCWKFFLFLDMLEKTEEGSWITYADAGCKIIETKHTLFDLISEMIKSEKVISAFPCKNYLEKKWTKGDLFSFLQTKNNENITNSDILMAGIITFQNCNETKKFFSTCNNIAFNNPHFLDDSPSFTSNFPEFIENRHDQSLLSLMRKLHPELVYITEEKRDFFIQAERIRE